MPQTIQKLSQQEARELFWSRPGMGNPERVAKWETLISQFKTQQQIKKERAA